MPTRRQGSPRPLAPFVAALFVSACTMTAPTAAPTATTPPPASASPVASHLPDAEVYASIRTDVQAIRGLQPTTDVDPVTIDEAQLRTNLTAEFDSENSATDLKFSEETLVALGLLPAGSSLRDLTLDFQGSQVAGYYSPDKNELFVVSRSGGLGPAEEVTYAHEFTHQLQDQHFDLGKLGVDATNQSDRALAQLALIEGDAVSVQNRWTIANLTPEEMGQLLTASLDPKALEALQRAPAYLREASLFPYLNGNPFVETLIAGGGYAAVNDAFAQPPLSTEQILHPEKYVQQEPSVAVKLPPNLGAKMGAGWTDAGQDTLGEFVLGLWLTQNGVTSAAATAAAAGWGGDRLVLLRGPSGTNTVGLVTMWDTEEDAAAFSNAATTAIERLGTIETRHLLSGSKAVVVTLGDGAKKLMSLIGGAAALGQ
jgi:hypothetical protein